MMNMAENITCVGSRNRNVKDSDNETRTVYNEGRAGFTSFNYTSGSPYTGGTDGGGDESPNNKWYDPTNAVFSTSYYFQNHFPSNQTSPTMMVFFLGMNDLMTAHTISEIVTNIKNMIDDIRNYNSTLPIVVVSPQLRYIPSLNGNEQLSFLSFAKAMEKMTLDYTNMIFVPLVLGMDSTNNYNMKQVSINTRSDVTEKTANDITHPADAGYWQIADYILGAISYLAQQ